MKNLCACILASTLLLLVLSSSEARTETTATTTGDRVLTGELVVTDAAHNRFRLVTHGGSFAAPAGALIETLDGKPVQVELERDGRVLQISEMAIDIAPITHGFEIDSGQLEVIDAALHTFTIAGTNRTYVAPLRIDVRPYAGRMVEVRLDEDGQVSDIALATQSDDRPVGFTCSYRGQRYSDGASLCQSGTQSLCEHGQWRNLVTACALDGTTASRWPRSCLFADASVADGSSICRSGRTYHCVDGEWLNIGTACS